MRILIPAFGFEDCFVDNVEKTLVEMGHEVRTLGYMSHKKYWTLPRYATRVAREMVMGDKPDRVGQKIIKLAKEFKPDVVLSVTGLVHPVVLEELGKFAAGRRVLWWGDPPANNQKWGILDPGWDWVYIKDRAAVNKLRLAGRNAHLLHEAMNPRWHKPVAGQRNGSVVVAGNYYAFRQAIILKLLADGVVFELYGARPPRWAHPEIKRLHTGKYVTGEEKSRVFGEGAACLNTFSLAEGNSLNCRAFEVAGAGGLQIIEYRSAIEECFEPGKELLTFQAYEELLDHLGRAQTHPEEARPIREAGARRALAEHTYRHRLQVILDNV
ncbi:MAG TPA: glycosyltransferase [Pyrinomonadaceae bacterium]|nr:glycosyltransferase [Pyrinomonadaceae bacterium]